MGCQWTIYLHIFILKNIIKKITSEFQLAQLVNSLMVE